MNTRSSTRPDPSKASGSADAPAEPTHSEVHVETPHVERPQDLALPAYAPRTDAAHADAPHTARQHAARHGLVDQPQHGQSRTPEGNDCSSS